MIENVDINGINYKVEVVDKFEMSDTDRVNFLKDGHDPNNMTKWGECTYEEASIKLWSGLSEQKKEQTLIHEMLHAVFHESGFEDHDEDEVNRLSITLYQVLKSNDFAFIRK